MIFSRVAHKSHLILVLLYDSEAWTISISSELVTWTFENFKEGLGISVYILRKRSEDMLYDLCGDIDKVHRIKRHGLRWLGHDGAFQVFDAVPARDSWRGLMESNLVSLDTANWSQTTKRSHQCQFWWTFNTNKKHITGLKYSILNQSEGGK